MGICVAKENIALPLYEQELVEDEMHISKADVVMEISNFTSKYRILKSIGEGIRKGNSDYD